MADYVEKISSGYVHKFMSNSILATSEPKLTQCAALRFGKVGEADEWIADSSLKAWFDGRFFSATIGDSKQRNTTSATAGDLQRQQYVKLTSLVA